MTEFTPYSALFGGMLIGLASILLLLTTGRIAGISGIVSRLLPFTGKFASDNKATSLLFVIGLLCALPLYQSVTGNVVEIQTVAGKPILLVAGLLVGFGTVMGSGCTSGHGVCGLSRFSIRSAIATLTFMASGVVTVFIARHLIGS